MRKAYRYLSAVLLFTLFSSGPVFAEKLRAPVGEPKPRSEIAEDFDNEEASETPDAARSGFFYQQNTPIYYPASSHWVTSVSAFGDSLVIEDESTWKLDPWNGRVALNWASNAPITITQNRSWFSSYDYYIVNQDTGEYIGANLYLGPAYESPYTVYIDEVNGFDGSIALSNNMRLQVCPGDYWACADWKKDHTVVLGVNGGWQSGKYNLILINVNQNAFVRAAQL